MAGFQLAGPAADVSKILYGENRKSYQSPNAQYNISGFKCRHTVECSDFVKLGAFELQGRVAQRGELRSRITITLSIFIFSTFFLLQNCRESQGASF
jgi:hypothetical protein